MSTEPYSDRVRVRRHHERGRYDRAAIHAVLDATPMCSVGYIIDGKPYVTPTLQWREGEHVYWHGSSASRMLRSVDHAEVCLTVATFDGFVLARSGMNHSINSRSAMLFGTARKVTDTEKKERHLQRFVDGLFPGRWDMLRPITQQELKATTLMFMPIEEASAKIRTGQPLDDDGDYALPIWGGVLPVRMEVLPPEPDPRNLEGVEMPGHVSAFKFG